MKTDRPKVGVGVIITRGDKILVGERLSKIGRNTFQISGGYLEFGETFEECAIREAMEETGLKNLAFKGIVSLGNNIMEDAHSVSVGVLLESLNGEPSEPEPERSKNWKWCDPRELPEPFFEPSRMVIKNWLSGNFYSQ